ncbi:MAG: DNA alkylation repair protein [Oscillospiraceae bacterium]
MFCLQSKLFEMQDLPYRDFHSKLMPTIDKDLIIGVRTPVLRKFAKEFSKSSEATKFMKILPHKYYEENNLHGFLIETINDYDKTIIALDEFLPYVDNWATCDLLNPKVFKNHLPELIVKIKEWLKSENTFTIRFGIKMLMQFYLGEEFKIEYPNIVAAIKSEEYYVKMMIAWYFATALAKQYDNVLPFLKSHRLDAWTYNKAIQKALESYRVNAEQKEYLKTLKIN